MKCQSAGPASSQAGSDVKQVAEIGVEGSTRIGVGLSLGAAALSPGSDEPPRSSPLQVKKASMSIGMPHRDAGCNAMHVPLTCHKQ